MKLRARTACLFKVFSNNTTNSLRDTARQTSIPKSSVHRHKSNQAKRVACVGHTFFETEEGFAWLSPALTHQFKNLYQSISYFIPQKTSSRCFLYRVWEIV